MNLTEDEKAYLYLDRLIYRLASVVNWHNIPSKGSAKDLKKVVEAVEEPTPVYFDTDSIDVNARYNIVLSNRGNGKSAFEKMRTKFFLNSVYGMTVTEKTLKGFNDYWHRVATGMQRANEQMEEKKMTNGEKMKEVFGTTMQEKACFGYIDNDFDCKGVECRNCPYWGENWCHAEYKAPKKVTQRRAKFFSNLDELLSYVHEHEITESDVINVTKSEGLSSVNWCLTYNEHYFEREKEE